LLSAMSFLVPCALRLTPQSLSVTPMEVHAHTRGATWYRRFAL
jgi:hypothetical protein